MVVLPRLKVLPLAGPPVCAMEAPEQLSVTVGAVQFATALQEPPAFTVMLLGHATMVGTCVSFTVTVKLQLAVLLNRSVTV